MWNLINWRLVSWSFPYLECDERIVFVVKKRSNCSRGWSEGWRSDCGAPSHWRLRHVPLARKYHRALQLTWERNSELISPTSRRGRDQIQKSEWKYYRGDYFVYTMFALSTSKQTMAFQFDPSRGIDFENDIKILRRSRVRFSWKSDKSRFIYYWVELKFVWSWSLTSYPFHTG